MSLVSLGSGSEYEAEHGVSAAIAMGYRTNQTHMFTYPDIFNETLGNITNNINEAQVAVEEAHSLDDSERAFNQGSDPW